MAETTRLLTEELGADLVVLGVRRHELPRLPEAVLREAVANAVAHRVYESSSRPVRVELRPDAVTITSPGPLPEPVSCRADAVEGQTAQQLSAADCGNRTTARTLARTRVLGLELPWLLLGVLSYPVIVGVAVVYIRLAERNEDDFAELVDRS